MMARTKTPTLRRRLSDGKGKSKDIRVDYNAFIAIYSEEEGKRFYSLVKRNFSKPKYFDDEVLLKLGIKGTIYVFYNKLGWSKLATTQYDVFFELTIEFYTIFKILDANQWNFSCRFFRKNTILIIKSCLISLAFLKEAFFNLHWTII